MNYLSIAQYMAAAALLTVAGTHLFVWTRARGQIAHLLFAVTAAAAGANAITEESMYRADSIDLMRWALRWYVATSGCWAIAAVCFIANYAGVGRIGRNLAIAIVAVCVVALVVNLFSPASFLYTELTGLRKIELPWGEQICLAEGKDRPLRLVAELAWLGVLGVAAEGSYRLWLRQQRKRAVLFAATVFAFMACFGTHAFLVDTGELNSPYLSTYGFLALVALMSYELAGEVMRTAVSSELRQKDTERHAAVAEERSRIARDLHDSVTQTLFSTAAIADALPEVWQRRPNEALRGLEDLKQMTKGALAEMRTLLLELRPATLTEKPLGELLQHLARSTSGRTRIPVDVEIDGQRQFPNDVQVTFYRAAQEALHNVVKHAQASHMLVGLSCNGRKVVLTIRDNGRGLGTTDAAPTGMGLEIMRERVRAIGGSLEIESEPQGGTTVTVDWTDKSGSSDEC